MKRMGKHRRPRGGTEQKTGKVALGTPIRSRIDERKDDESEKSGPKTKALEATRTENPLDPPEGRQQNPHSPECSLLSAITEANLSVQTREVLIESTDAGEGAEEQLYETVRDRERTRSPTAQGHGR